MSDTVVQESANNSMNLFGLFAILPFIFSIVMIGLVIWFAVAFMKTQKEKNAILRDISNHLQFMKDKNS
ncbi:hypothetical protein [Gracilibacillus sp. YIM 98692]|uniref:hypothetical protein n=1 Tax=Gracilibacillus sp. YIM 98692 TaxID=2663532 RepID=UPI0013D8A901|nr:hypothetical protein [Gracilibacillus sp. YIM 98692]